MQGSRTARKHETSLGHLINESPGMHVSAIAPGCKVAIVGSVLIDFSKHKRRRHAKLEAPTSQANAGGRVYAEKWGMAVRK